MLAASATGCPLGDDGGSDERPRHRDAPQARPGALRLYTAPGSILAACAEVREERAGAPVLCPTRLPRISSDPGTDGIVPAEALGLAPVRDPDTHAVIGIEVGHAGDGGLRFRVVEAGFVAANTPPATSLPVQRSFTRAGRRYVASMSDVGDPTAAVLRRVIRALRPAGSLGRRRTDSGGARTTTFPSPVRGPVSLAAAGTAIFVGGQGGAGAPPRALVPGRPSVARVLAERPRAPARTTVVGRAPGSLAVIQGEAVIWVVHRAGGSALRMLDPGTGDPIGTVGGLTAPVAVTVGHDSVWVADSVAGDGRDGAPRGVVQRIRATGARFEESIRVGRAPAGVAADAGGVWVTNAADDTVMRIDARTERVVATVDVGDRPTGVVARAGSVWVATSGDGTVTRIDPRSGRVTATTRAGRGVRSIAYGGGSVWAANELDDTVTRISARTARVLETIEVGAGPAAVVYAQGAAWVANNLDHSITRIADD